KPSEPCGDSRPRRRAGWLRPPGRAVVELAIVTLNAGAQLPGDRDHLLDERRRRALGEGLPIRPDDPQFGHGRGTPPGRDVRAVVGVELEFRGPANPVVPFCRGDVGARVGPAPAPGNMKVVAHAAAP